MPNKQRRIRRLQRRVPPKIKFKVGDPIIVIAGKDAGTRGSIRSINKKRGTVLVDGVNIVHKTKRKSNENPNGDIMEVPAPIHVSNVMYYHAKLNKALRIGHKINDEGKKVRYNHKHGIQLDA